jgi:hypothetical protein
VKGMLDGKSKLKTYVKRGGDADELSTLKCTFPVIVMVLIDASDDECTIA